jgi:hypothetical protein
MDNPESYQPSTIGWRADVEVPMPSLLRPVFFSNRPAYQAAHSKLFDRITLVDRNSSRLAVGCTR